MDIYKTPRAKGKQKGLWAIREQDNCYTIYFELLTG